MHSVGQVATKQICKEERKRLTEQKNKDSVRSRIPIDKSITETKFNKELGSKTQMNKMETLRAIFRHQIESNSAYSPWLKDGHSSVYLFTLKDNVISQ